MELITPQIAIGLLLISIGVVSKFDIKFDFLGININNKIFKIDNYII